MNPSLRALRWRLTLWYVGVFALVMLLLGGALLIVLTRQSAARLDRSLEAATAEVIRAAEIREQESKLPPGSVVDAFEELRIPGRMVYVFDHAGRLVHPDTVPPWVPPAAAAALSEGRAWNRVETAGDHTYRLFARRFEFSAGTPWVAVAAADVDELQEEYASLILAFSLAGLASLVLVAIGGAALARRSTEPVEQTLAQMRRFMADAAHELRTPLTVLRGRAEVALQRSRSTDQYATALAGIAEETQRMTSLVEKMLLHSQADAGNLRMHREEVFLDDLLVDAAEDARVLAAGRDVRVEILELEEAPILADRHLVRQMLLTVFDNAVRFSPRGGRVSAVASFRNGVASAMIRDAGPGIPPDVLPHIFEPFYRGDGARERTGSAGLGLAIAKSIAAAHGATIEVAPETGGGTRVTITFPSR